MDGKTIVEAMREMAPCFMATAYGNAQVEWDGRNWFFRNGDTRKVRKTSETPATERHVAALLGVEHEQPKSNHTAR